MPNSKLTDDQRDALIRKMLDDLPETPGMAIIGQVGAEYICNKLRHPSVAGYEPLNHPVEVPPEDLFAKAMLEGAGDLDPMGKVPHQKGRLVYTLRSYSGHPKGSLCLYWQDGGVGHLLFENGDRAEVPYYSPDQQMSVFKFVYDCKEAHGGTKMTAPPTTFKVTEVIDLPEMNERQIEALNILHHALEPIQVTEEDYNGSQKTK